MLDNENNEGLKTCKVVLVGESGVGKSCITARFVHDTFDDTIKPTQSAAFVTKNLKFEDEKSIKFDIWDTCGQEKFRSLGKIFYKGISIAILVYDITSKQSFEQLENFWIGQIKEYAPKNTNKFIFFNLFFHNYSHWISC